VTVARYSSVVPTDRFLGEVAGELLACRQDTERIVSAQEPTNDVDMRSGYAFTVLGI